MPRKQPQPPAEGELSRLERTLAQIERRLEGETRWRPVMLRAFAAGICTALGAMAAVAIIVPVTIWMLRGVHWPAALNGLIEDLATRIEQAQQDRRGVPPPARSSSSSSSFSGSVLR